MNKTTAKETTMNIENAKLKFAQEIKAGDSILITNGEFPRPAIWMIKGKQQEIDSNTRFTKIVSIKINENTAGKYIRFDVRTAGGQVVFLDGTIKLAAKYIVKVGA